ncbi:MAG: hypothetical protein RLY56_19 [Pseudomonadota bacterium]
MKSPPALLEPRGTAVLDDYIVDIAWAADGSRLAVAGGEGKVCRIENSSDALSVSEVGQHGLGALAVAWHPKQALFVSSGQDGELRLYDAIDGKVLARQRPSKSWTTHLTFSPDGSQLASAAGKQISLWNSQLESQHALPSLEATVAALGFDKSGRDLAAAINGGVVVHRLEGPRYPVRHYRWAAPCITVNFSGNGKFLAAGTQDGSVHFWYLATGRDSQMRGYPGKVDQLGWSGDSRYLATAAGDRVVVWDFGGKGPEGSSPQQLAGHTDRIECLAYQPRGNFLATAGLDWRLSLWLPGKFPAAIDAHLTDSEPSCLRWSPDGRFLALGERKGKLSIFELVRI